MQQENIEIKNLYHYTDFNAMQGIIVKGEIWLWNLRRMNDSQEMEYFIKELKLAVKNKLLPDEIKTMEELFQSHLKDFKTLSSYAACFSEYADDAAQWARYAKNGMGVCIAFNKELLSQIGDAGKAPLCKVNYSKSVEDLDLVSDLTAAIKNYKCFNQEQINELFNRLISSSPLFKHPSFISEKEFRLVSLPYNIEENLGKAHFYVEETNIKEYYILNLQKICSQLNIHYSDLFTEICIGPQARVTRNVLSNYLSANGYDELCSKIKISECPLRRF